MLYDGAIRTLERALPGFSHDDPAEANMMVHNNLQRAQEIIRELNYSLNMDQGGECALTLRRLYDYFDRRLWKATCANTATASTSDSPPDRFARCMGCDAPQG